MAISIWSALSFGFLQPFTLSFCCITLIYSLWLITLSMAEQERPGAFKHLLFANLTSRSLQFHPHLGLLKRASLFIAVFLFCFSLAQSNLVFFKAFFLVLTAVCLILLGLDTLGFLYLESFFKGKEQDNLSSALPLTPTLLGLTLGFIWKGPAQPAKLVFQSKTMIVILAYYFGLALSLFILANLINMTFNVFPKLRKLEKQLLNLVGLLFILLGFALLLGRCPFLG